jgi:very-short-patch-repair endonuclease
MVSTTYNAKKKKTLRQKLRNATTSAEAILWTYLQRRQLLGKKFRRQESLGRYIVDFYCPECRVIVELDGAPHFEPNSDVYENERTAYLAGLGLTVIRFENQAIHDDIDLVLECIREALRNAQQRGIFPSSPRPCCPRQDSSAHFPPDSTRDSSKT